MSDQEFILRVQSMERRLYRVACAILWNDADCADAIQEAVFKAWLKRGSLREERYFETWLTRILINECKTLLRRRKFIQLPLEEAAPGARDDDLCGDLHLRSALAALPEKYRVPLLLHHLEGYGLEEVAQILKITPQMVKSRLYQARGKLARLLDEGGEGHEAKL